MSLRIDRTLTTTGPTGAIAKRIWTHDCDGGSGNGGPTWAARYAHDPTVDAAVEDGRLTIDGDRAALAQFFAGFDQPHLATELAP